MDSFNAFLVSRDANLRRIAAATGREYRYEEVVNEAWLMAAKLGSHDDLADQAFQDRVLAYLYQALVRYTGRTVRWAKSLDHASVERDDGTASALMAMLVGDEGRHPLTELLAADDIRINAARMARDTSLMSAWLILLHHHDFRMERVAARLLISVSYAYRCRARARRIAQRQNALPLALPADASCLGPWRRHRFDRAPLQRELDFGQDTGLLGTV